MSSINFQESLNISQYSAGYPDQQNFDKGEEDDAQFFSIANQYNERKAKMTNHRVMEAMNMTHNFNIKNNPKEMILGEAKEEKVRKTRSDQEGREFICGACKSGYLSYPALYTHIKTKHNGIAPEGTIRGKNNNNKKRGRPKSIRKQPQFHYDKQPENTFPKQYCDLVPKSQISNAYEDDEQQQIQQKGQITLPLFIKQLKELRKSVQSISVLPLIKVLVIYLNNIKQYMRDEVFETIELISQKMVEEINSQYEKRLSDYQDQSYFYVRRFLPQQVSTSKNKNQVQAPILYCSYQKCDYVPVFAYHLLKRLDPEYDQIQCDFLTDFCGWLYDQKLTHIKLVKTHLLEATLVEQEEV